MHLYRRTEIEATTISKVSPAKPAEAKSPSTSASSKTLSSNDSDSDSEGSDSDSDSTDEETSKPSDKAKSGLPKKPEPSKKARAAESSSSSSSSSDSASSESDSSDSDSDSDPDSDSSSSDEDEDDKPKQKKTKTPAKAAKVIEVSKEQVSVTKKRRTDKEGASVPTAVSVNVQNLDATPASSGDVNGNEKKRNGEGKKPRKANTPFQRVKADQVTFADPRLKDNRFESRVRRLAPTRMSCGSRSDLDAMTREQLRQIMVLVLRGISLSREGQVSGRRKIRRSVGATAEEISL